MKNRAVTMTESAFLEFVWTAEEDLVWTTEEEDSVWTTREIRTKSLMCSICSEKIRRILGCNSWHKILKL